MLARLLYFFDRNGQPLMSDNKPKTNNPRLAK